jgi:hypothetical protein
MKDELVRKKKVATGNLANEIESYVEEEDDRAFLYLDVPSYGKFIDSGRKPGSKYPPVKSIRDWIKVKGIKPNKSRGVRTEEQLIFLIRRAIGIRGIDPVPFLDIWDIHTDELEELIEDAAAEDVEDVINAFVKDFNKNNN